MLRKLLLSAALGLLVTLTALADDTPPPATTAEKPPTIELYRVKNADLAEVQQAFAALVGRPTRLTKSGPSRGPGGDTTGPGRGKGGTGTFTRPVPDDPFTPETTPTGGAAPAVVARGIADPRTRSLIVRGTERDQQVAADLVAVLDTPEGKALPPVKALKAFRLQYIDATDLVNLLQTLDPRMTYRLAPVPNAKLLLATGTEEQMKELTDAVKKLDIPPDTK